MTRDKFITRVTEGLRAADVLQMAEHLTELYWPDATWFCSGHVRFLRSELRAMYGRWTGVRP